MIEIQDYVANKNVTIDSYIMLHVNVPNMESLAPALESLKENVVNPSCLDPQVARKAKTVEYLRITVDGKVLLSIPAKRELFS